VAQSTTAAPGTTVVDVPVPPAPDTTPTTPAPTTSTSPPPPADLSREALANATYPVEVCAVEQGVAATSTVTLVDGSATVPFRDPELAHTFAYHYDLTDVLYGDLTGDGQEDAVVRMRCALEASDGIWDVFVLVSDDGGQPAVLTWRDDSGFPTQASVTQPDGTVEEWTRFETVLDVWVDGGRLFVRWNQAAHQFGAWVLEQRQTTVSYRWDGNQLLPLGESDVVIVPPSDGPTDEVASEPGGEAPG
jgi:hypothetical protein